jgi:hypothetical protein
VLSYSTHPRLTRTVALVLLAASLCAGAAAVAGDAHALPQDQIPAAIHI